MGGGKGSIDHYVTPIKAGRIIVELGGRCEFAQAYPFLREVAEKLPFRAKVTSYEEMEAEKQNEIEKFNSNLNPYTSEYVIKNKKQRKGMMVKCLDPNCAPWSPCIPCSTNSTPKNEGKKPCICSGCGEKFNSKGSFWRHKRHCIDPTTAHERF